MTFEFKPSLDRKMELINGRMYEYEIFKILDTYDDRLKTKAEPWDFARAPANLTYLATSMIKTMVRNHGIGLAANQVGLPWAFFCMGGLEKYIEFVVNPTLVKGEGEVVEQEGCLSSPGLYLEVPRYKTIEVEYFDMTGIKKAQKFDGLSARVFQHEYDHILGVRYQDKVSPIHLERARGKVKKNLKKWAETLEMYKKQQAVQQNTSPDQVVDTTHGVQYVIKT